MPNRLVWISYASDDDTFNGVAIVEITPADIAFADERLAILHPDALPESAVIFAAVKKARDLGISPGGQAICQDINYRIPPDCIGRLLQRDELIERELGQMITDEDFPEIEPPGMEG